MKSVAAEFNRLLDWLNDNPPVGAKIGNDLIEVGQTERLTALNSEEEVGFEDATPQEIDHVVAQFDD